MSGIESVLKETRSFPPAASFVEHATVPGREAYNVLCDKAVNDYEGFWGELARELLHWQKPFSRVLDNSQAPFFRWFDDGELNASYNCIDRHLPHKAAKTAIIFEADDGQVEHISYQQLHDRVARFANGLLSLGMIS